MDIANFSFKETDAQQVWWKYNKNANCLTFTYFPNKQK